MNTFFLIAGILCILLGILHSILGEYQIFNNKRKKRSLVPSIANSELEERHLRIIWATWHLASIFGCCIGAILIEISMVQNGQNASGITFIIQSVIYSMFLSSFLVFVGTKGKHPGWIILLLIGILLIIGN